MIKIYLGNVGSGKTLSAVRDMCINKNHRVMFSNIETKGVKNNIVIKGSMIIKKDVIGYKKSGEPLYKFSLNEQYWRDMVAKYGCIDIILDEIHTLLNSRRGMTKQAVIMTDFLSLLRRILGSKQNQGDLIMITQLERRIDIIAKEMCNHCRFHICHFTKTCQDCGKSWNENNEMPEQKYSCPRCQNINIMIHSHVIEVWHFSCVDDFIRWKYFGKKMYYKHYFINDAPLYFVKYNTLQWGNLLTEI